MNAISTEVKTGEAKAFGRALPISVKHSVEVCRFIRGKMLIQAKEMLSAVITQKVAVPYLRFHKDLGHKKGMAAGRYPEKTCSEILKILESAEANAQFQGMSTANLIVRHVSAQKGPRTQHQGRLGRDAKRAHIEVVLAETKSSEKPRQEKKKQAKQPVKTEIQAQKNEAAMQEKQTASKPDAQPVK